MRVSYIECDRCKTKIEGRGIPSITVNNPGHSSRNYDLCETCLASHTEWLKAEKP